ncbi:MAG: phospholipase [Streptosporangiaceae bacterium]|nr:phospholipase [Streptosporangiaceae bacterium]
MTDQEASDRENPEETPEPTRRRFIAGGAAVAALGAAGATGHRPGAGKLTDSQARLIDKVMAAPAAGASLSDVEHVVILMQENRSFDHYFGTLSGVRGFSDPGVLTQKVGGVTYPVFDQFGYKPGTGVDANGYMQPFNLLNHPPTENGYDTNDISHDWATQHHSWNNGAMNAFMTSHLSSDGTTNGPVTMGYYTRSELAFYYALADAFTVCDGYFCSVLGPTDPNRLMAMSAWIDPAGKAGGPVITTAFDRLAMTGKLSWKTMPEALLEAGVSWKVYNDPTGLLGLGVLPYFKAYDNPFSITGLELIARGLTPAYPDDFASDVASGSLPSVSWIIPPLYECEHPAAPPEWGEYLVQQILNTLVSNPAVWAKTVFIVVYDENGGFFDHVPPPAAPAGTAGEYLTGTLPSSAAGIAGPVGLGFRTPCLVVSPFSAGGYRYSGTLDHTSTLRFIETRWGVRVPNLSAWRRGVTGDFTGALALAKPPVTKVPSLPATTLIGNTTVVEEAVLNALAGTLDVGIPYRLPASNSMPKQETTPRRPPVP